MTDIKGFLIAFIPIALSPGVSFTLAVSNISIAGLRSALPVISGTGAGILIHGLLVGLGVSNFLVNSPSLNSALQICGILFLTWLGIRMLISGLMAYRKETKLVNRVSSFKEALLLNVFNVKAITLYLTVIPLYAGEGLGSYLILSVLHMAIMAAWIFLVGFAIVQAGKGIKLNVLSAYVNTIGGVFLLTATWVTAAI